MKEIKIDNFQEKLYYEKLKSGLEIFMIPQKKANNYYAMIGTRFGGNHSQIKRNNKKITYPQGIAHFLEHELYNQDLKVDPDVFYAKSGTYLNAATYPDRTIYYFTGNNKFKENLKYLLNWIPSFDISDKAVEKEKGIILEEEKQGQDEPLRILYYQVLKNLFSKETLKDDIVGTQDSIKSITKDDLINCYHDYYNPKNMFIIITGNFDEKESIKIIRENLKNYNNRKITTKKIKANEPNDIVKKYQELTLDIQTIKFGHTYKINKKIFKNKKEDTVIKYLRLFLKTNFNSTSDFFEEMQNRKLFTEFDYGFDLSDEFYLLEFYAVSDKYKELIKEIDKKIKNSTTTEEDLERAKKTWIAAEVRMYESPKKTALSLLEDVINNKKYQNNAIKSIKKLNLKEYNNIISKLYFDKYASVVIKPKDK